MSITDAQAKKFARLKMEQGMDTDEYLSHFSKKHIGKMVKKLNQLTEKDADIWLAKVRAEETD